MKIQKETAVNDSKPVELSDDQLDKINGGFIAKNLFDNIMQCYTNGMLSPKLAQEFRDAFYRTEIADYYYYGQDVIDWFCSRLASIEEGDDDYEIIWAIFQNS